MACRPVQVISASRSKRKPDGVPSAQTLGSSMNRQLKLAYALIREYNEGVFQPGSNISKEHQRLIKVLSKDLDVSSNGVKIEQLVLLVAKANSFWNKRTQALICNFYSLRDSGDCAGAERERVRFTQKCPSAWYWGIVNSL